MFDLIVHSLEPITLIGGGAADAADLRDALSLAPLCVAVDGGATLAVKMGVDVAAVIGDFDSVPSDVLKRIPKARQHQIDEQATTDFEKALLRTSAPAMICVGFSGGRVDHQLAALHTLIAFAHQPCILLTQDEVIFVAPPDISLPTCVGEVVSLFPLTAVTGQSEGLQWPIEGLKFAPGQKIGTSNRATGPMHLKMSKPGMLVILPRRLLGAVMQHFLGQSHARWPAPAQ